MKKNFVEQIVTGYDFLKGHIVFWSGTDWLCGLNNAVVAKSEEDLNHLLDSAKSYKLGMVVDIYKVAVNLDANGNPVPTKNREKLRIMGPSHRKDLANSYCTKGLGSEQINELKLW